MGQSSQMAALRELIARVCRSQAPVHITGESGTGKELVARLIHETGARADGPFVPVNCGAIPSELMESELFGHKRGSFTGRRGGQEGPGAERRRRHAVSRRGGRSAAAHAGQTAARDSGEDRAAGRRAARGAGRRARAVGNPQDPGRSGVQGRFREDLYYRINVIEIRVPALREHAEDIPELADAMLRRLSARLGVACAGQSAPKRALHCSTIPFPATCANWRTSWSARLRCRPRA